MGGSTITFAGAGWASETSVTVTYPATQTANDVTTTVQSDTSGNIVGTMTIPSSTNVLIGSDSTIRANALGGVQTASAIHSIPAAILTVVPITGAPGTPLTVTGQNFPIFTSVASLTVGGNSVSVVGVNTDSAGRFTMTSLIPGLTAGTAVVVATVGGVTANQTITVTATQTVVPAVTALGPLTNTQSLNIATSFDYSTGKYNSFVPGLPGNSLVDISPNSVIFITMTRDTTIVVSGVSFRVMANTPTPLPVGAAVTITVQ
jgi:hypothetical protein